MQGDSMLNKESHTFPSGLSIDYESSVGEDYHNELNSISSQQELESFVDKWKYLFPEIVSENLSFETLKSLRGNHEQQKLFVSKAKQDLSYQKHLDLLMPSTLLLYVMWAKEFMVPVGTVILQLWNGSSFKEKESGSWILQLQLKNNDEA
jgi:hypothetical protein